MTTKNPKTRPDPQATATGPAPDDLRAAYEIHTLAQMMYGQFAWTQPWMTQPPQTYGQMPFASHPQPPWTQQAQWTPQTPWTQQTQVPQAQWTPQWPMVANPWNPWWGR